MKSAQRLTEFLLIAAIVVLVNVAAQRVFYRCDLTDDQRYTLSDATATALASLDDTLTIKAFFSENIPPSQSALINGVKDTLSEYKALGGAGVQIEFIDPTSDPEIEQEMRMLGIPELQMTVVGRGELEQRKVYMGVGLFYQDKKEVIQAVQSLEDFEYNLTSAVLKLASAPKKVGVWLGNPLPATQPFWEDYQRYKLSEDLDTLYRSLRRQYDVTEVNFTGGKAVPSDVDTLLVIGPKKATDRDLYEIDQFIMRGGRVVFLLDESERDDQMRASPTPSGLEPLLESYGVRVGPSLVADRRCARARFTTRFMQSIAPYPFWPKVTEEGIEKENPALSSLRGVALMWTAPIEVLPSALGERKFTTLLKTSPYAKAHQLPAQVFGEQEGLLPGTTQTELTLAGLIEGPFKSYYAGRGAPAPTMPEGYESTPMPPVGEAPDFLESTENGRIIVVGSSNFITEGPLGYFQQMRSGTQNLVFIQNLVDWLTLGDGLIGIRSRVAPTYPLDESTESQQQFIQLVNIAAMPLLVILFGVARFLLRRRDRRLYEEHYQMSHSSKSRS